MSDLAIRLENLGKQYRIGTRDRYKTLRDTLSSAVSAPFQRLQSLVRPSLRAEIANPGDRFWALKDVSFEVPRGTVLGVIGRNGAGKSTLLKVLSRITEPTAGRVEILGRIGSLLEVGTGFHSELTGRENIFLNGAILGMRRAEITRRFDEIVAFAEVDKFIDTPVKHYSSGMYLRLAFAVAAHLEPEILIVDEVLAVGDIQFQKKCLGKMGDVAKIGRTVLLVSHQMSQLRKLSTSCVWLEDGRLIAHGSADDVISDYELSFCRRGEHETTIGRPERSRFVSWALEGGGAEGAHTVERNGPLTFSFRLHAESAIRKARHGIALFNSDNIVIWSYAFTELDLEPGDYDLRYTLPSLPIRPGVYQWDLSLFDDCIPVDRWVALPVLRVHTPMRGRASDLWQGVLNLPFSMEVHRPGDSFQDDSDSLISKGCAT
jgi:lipopolysaccharide transport system ATP-binding protein